MAQHERKQRDKRATEGNFFEAKEKKKGKSYGAKFPSRKDADMFEMLTEKAIGNATMN